MYLHRLSVHGLRNLEHVDINLAPTANFFYGENGSGKTSLLESLYLLSRGRSFRSRNLKAVIHHDWQECVCFGELRGEEGRLSTLGVSRQKSGDFTFKVGGEVVKTASRLAETLPVQLINNETFQLLEGSPGQRRGFVDWGVFHVEHSYRSLWVNFQRCLKHRNSLLRHGRIDRLVMASWDKEFSALALILNEHRERYLGELLPIAQNVIEQFGLPNQLDFVFYPGWDVNVSLDLLLMDSQERDSRAGFTHFGPHRAELRVTADNRPAAEVLSRGQTKMLVTALKIAQGFHYRDTTGQQCIYLLDDLPAELDQKHRVKVCQLLAELGVQVLITGPQKEDLTAAWPFTGGDGVSDQKPKVFHVKHGTVIESTY